MFVVGCYVQVAAGSARRPTNADVAQLVEQLIRNQQVTGSSPVVGSRFPKRSRDSRLPTMHNRHRGQQLGSSEFALAWTFAGAKRLNIRRANSRFA
jgi:hypothetical protein